MEAAAGKHGDSFVAVANCVDTIGILAKAKLCHQITIQAMLCVGVNSWCVNIG